MENKQINLATNFSKPINAGSASNASDASNVSVVDQGRLVSVFNCINELDDIKTTTHPHDVACNYKKIITKIDGSSGIFHFFTVPGELVPSYLGCRPVLMRYLGESEPVDKKEVEIQYLLSNNPVLVYSDKLEFGKDGFIPGVYNIIINSRSKVQKELSGVLIPALVDDEPMLFFYPYKMDYKVFAKHSVGFAPTVAPAIAPVIAPAIAGATAPTPSDELSCDNIKKRYGSARQGLQYTNAELSVYVPLVLLKDDMAPKGVREKYMEDLKDASHLFFNCKYDQSEIAYNKLFKNFSYLGEKTAAEIFNGLVRAIFLQSSNSRAHEVKAMLLNRYSFIKVDPDTNREYVCLHGFVELNCTLAEILASTNDFLLCKEILIALSRHYFYMNKTALLSTSDETLLVTACGNMECDILLVQLLEKCQLYEVAKARIGNMANHYDTKKVGGWAKNAVDSLEERLTTPCKVMRINKSTVRLLVDSGGIESAEKLMANLMKLYPLKNQDPRLLKIDCDNSSVNIINIMFLQVAGRYQDALELIIIMRERMCEKLRRKYKRQNKDPYELEVLINSHINLHKNILLELTVRSYCGDLSTAMKLMKKLMHIAINTKKVESGEPVLGELEYRADRICGMIGYDLQMAILKLMVKDSGTKEFIYSSINYHCNKFDFLYRLLDKMIKDKHYLKMVDDLIELLNYKERMSAVVLSAVSLRYYKEGQSYADDDCKNAVRKNYCYQLSLRSARNVFKLGVNSDVANNIASLSMQKLGYPKDQCRLLF